MAYCGFSENLLKMYENPAGDFSLGNGANLKSKIWFLPLFARVFLSARGLVGDNPPVKMDHHQPVCHYDLPLFLAESSF